MVKYKYVLEFLIAGLIAFSMPYYANKKSVPTELFDKVFIEDTNGDGKPDLTIRRRYRNLHINAKTYGRDYTFINIGGEYHFNGYKDLYIQKK